MNQELKQVTASMLGASDIDEQALFRVLGDMLGHTIDRADIYFQSTHVESWCIEDSIIKDASFHVEKGVGVRANANEKTGFAYSNDILLPALTEAANAVKCIARSGTEHHVNMMRPQEHQTLYPDIDPLDSLSQEDKLHLLKEADRIARAEDSRVTHVNAELTGVFETVLIADSDGLLQSDIRPLVRLDITVVLEDKGKREKAHVGGGLRGDYRYFTDHDCVSRYAKEAVRRAIINMDAIPAPAGTMPVVLGPGWPGVLLHEAVGHGLEADFNRKGSSAFSGRLGEQVASPLCTVVDNGAMSHRRGSLNIDDEGTPTQCTTLIENGILKSYMQDKLSASLMNMAPTGNGRRESYSHVPMPRMTNTYMLAGQDVPEDIIKSVKKGIYAVNFGGGQVDITSGKFVFCANEAYLIEDGKVTAPIKGATLIGNGPEVLNKVSMVGHDLKLDEGVGICGKDGQQVPVGVGQPTLKIDELTVGGTKIS